MATPTSQASSAADPPSLEVAQASLELSVGLPTPPEDLRPMLPRLNRRLPPFGEDRLVDPTWGGLRVLAAVRRDRVHLRHDGLDVAARFPGITTALAGLDLPDAVLDGEIVVAGRAGRGLAAAVHKGREIIAPATLVISDLPWFEGRARFAEMLVRRRARLIALGIAGPGLVVLEGAAGSEAVLDVVRLHGLLGIVTKRVDSPYLPGHRSRLWSLVLVADLDVDSLRPAADSPASAAAPMLTGTDGADAPTETPRRADIALLRQLPLGEDG